MNEQPEPSEEVENDPPAPTPKGNRIRRWERTVLLALVVSALVATSIWFLLPPAKPTVAAKIDIPAKRSSVFGPNPLLDSDSSISPEVRVARVKSRMVLNAALNNQKVQKADLSVLRDRDPISWLEQELKVDFPYGPEILRVSIIGDETEELIILVDAVVDAYLKDFLGDQTLSLKDRIERQEKVLAGHQKRADLLAKEKRTLAKAIGAGHDKAIEQKQKWAQLELGLAKTEFQKLKTELINLEHHQLPFYERAAKGGDAIKITPSLVDTQIESKSAMKLLRAQETELNGIIAKRAAVDGADSVVVKKHLTRRNEVLKSIEGTRQRLLPEVEKELGRAAQSAAQAKLIDIKEQLGALKDLEKVQKQDIERLENDAESVNERGLDLQGINLRCDTENEIIKNLTQKLEELKSERDAPPWVRKLEDASVSRPDELPRKLRFAGIGAASTFALVLLLAAYLGFRSRQINSVN